jgi:type II secretory ATPase GspE/PulE/Tfp pilus assembly ATPase PilB-like protein
MDDNHTASPDAVGDAATELKVLLDEAAERGASDVHLEPFGSGVRVRMRIDGVVTPSRRLAQASPELIGHVREQAALPDPSLATAAPGEILAEASSLPAYLRQYFYRPGALESAVMHLGTLRVDGGHRWRVATMHGVDGERLCLHRVHWKPPTLEAVGLAPAERSELVTANGIVLFTGPPGHGTTTTFYSALAAADPERRVILTIEEVVEASLPGVHQTELAGRRVNLGTLMRATLQQDPDVVGLGAIVDYGTASLAVSSAISGVTVFGAMRLNEAVLAINQLLFIGIEPYMLVASLKQVVNQRLVRLNCARCVAPDTAAPEHLAELERAGLGTDQLQIGRGCEHCEGTGVQGRMAVLELLRLTPELNQLILQGASNEEIKEAAVASGMRTLRSQALGLAAEGTISLAEALRVTPAERSAPGPDLRTFDGFNAG